MASDLDRPPGLAGWFVPRDPRRLALLFLAALMACLVVGGWLGLQLRAHLFAADSRLLTGEQYSGAFTLHGLLLALVFAVPAIPATIGNFAVPLQVGARAAALPWIGVASFYTFVISIGLLQTSVPGLSQPTPGGPPWTALVGLFGLAISAGLTALGLIATIHDRDARALPWRALPLFVWASYFGAVATLVSVVLLVVFGVVALQEPDLLVMRAYVVFAAIPGLTLVPALGLVCEILEVHARGLVIRRLVAAALVVLALVAVPAWSLHVRAAAIADQFGRGAVGLLLCAWAVPLVRGGRGATTPLIYAAAAIVALLISNATGAVLAFGVPLDDTYFMVGHYHLRMDVVVFALLGGLHHWWPRLTGCMYSESAGRVGASLVTVGLMTHEIATLVLGHDGMPRRYMTYLPEFTDLQRVASIGAFVAAAGLVWTLFYLGDALRRRRPAAEDPWGRGPPPPDHVS